MVLYIINELTENVNNAQMLNGAQWHFLPVGNPDGYEFTRNPSGVCKFACLKKKFLNYFKTNINFIKF